jgi:hypothetical protein
VDNRLRTTLVALGVAGAIGGGTAAYAASGSSTTTTTPSTTTIPKSGTTDPGQLEGQGQAPSQGQGQGHSGNCPGM